MEQPSLKLLIPILVIFLAFLLWALIDLIRRDTAHLRGNELFGKSVKFVWLAVILFLNLTGPFLYLMLARKRGPQKQATTTET